VRVVIGHLPMPRSMQQAPAAFGSYGSVPETVAAASSRSVRTPP